MSTEFDTPYTSTYPEYRILVAAREIAEKENGALIPIDTVIICELADESLADSWDYESLTLNFHVRSASNEGTIALPPMHIKAVEEDGRWVGKLDNQQYSLSLNEGTYECQATLVASWAMIDNEPESGVIAKPEPFFVTVHGPDEDA